MVHNQFGHWPLQLKWQVFGGSTNRMDIIKIKKIKQKAGYNVTIMHLTAYPMQGGI
jgi:hypothetical protein